MIYLAWALVEIANITVFGYLAYHFNHWWIVLFSILLSCQIKTKKWAKMSHFEPKVGQNEPL